VPFVEASTMNDEEDLLPWPTRLGSAPRDSLAEELFEWPNVVMLEHPSARTGQPGADANRGDGAVLAHERRDGSLVHRRARDHDHLVLLSDEVGSERLGSVVEGRARHSMGSVRVNGVPLDILHNDGRDVVSAGRSTGKGQILILSGPR
jgi:hypothetical protein